MSWQEVVEMWLGYEEQKMMLARFRQKLNGRATRLKAAVLIKEIDRRFTELSKKQDNLVDRLLSEQDWSDWEG